MEDVVFAEELSLRKICVGKTVDDETFRETANAQSNVWLTITSPATRGSPSTGYETRLHDGFTATAIVINRQRSCLTTINQRGNTSKCVGRN